MVSERLLFVSAFYGPINKYLSPPSTLKSVFVQMMQACLDTRA